MQDDKDTREPPAWSGSPKAAPPVRNQAPGLWLFTLLLTAIVVVPIVVSLVPREIGRWYLATALEQRKSGAKEEAYTKLDQAIGWDKEEPVYYLQRANWRREDGQYQAALDDCNRAIELAGTGGESKAALKFKFEALSSRAQIYQHLGRHGAAIADWKQIDQMSTTSGIPHRALALNGLAYARAVGKLELKEGLANADEALKLLPGVDSILDTRGFLRYELGDYPGALEDLDKAVQGAEQFYEDAEKKRAGKPRSEMDQRLMSPAEQQEMEAEQSKQAVAVIRYHRSLVYDKLGREEDAKKDRARVKELIGREPDETLF
jgi:tetratricopeptide (TPR) repeat protein